MKVYLFFCWTRSRLNRLANAMVEGLRMVIRSGAETRPGTDALAPAPVPVQVPRARVTRRWRA